MWLRRRSRLPAPMEEADPAGVAEASPVEGGTGKVERLGDQTGRGPHVLLPPGDHSQGELLQRGVLHGRQA